MSNKVVDWGAEIPVDGKRPDWLGDGQPIIQIFDGGQVEVLSEIVYKWSRVSSIRLPADHPHYRNVEPQEPPLPPEWAIRRARTLLEAEMKSGVAGHVNRAFARYIAEHEEAPVDRALELAAEFDAHDKQGYNPETFDNITPRSARWLHGKGLLREVGE